MDTSNTGAAKEDSQQRSTRWQRVSMKNLEDFTKVACKQEYVVDPVVLHNASILMMLSLDEGSKIEVLYIADGRFYPATVTRKSRGVLHFTYDDTNEKERDTVRCDEFSTRWRFPATTKQQRWLCRAVETLLM